MAATKYTNPTFTPGLLLAAYVGDPEVLLALIRQL